MQNQYTAESQSQFLIEGLPQPQIQIQYQTQPQNQIQQHQVQPIYQPQQYQVVQPIYQPQQQPAYLIPVAQQTLIIDDSKFCNEMCCTLVWLIFGIIPCIATILFLSGYYLYLNLIFLVAAFLIIIAICTKNETIYRVGYIFYCIYAILNVIADLMIVFFFWAYSDTIIQYIGITSFGKDTTNLENVEKSLMVYRIIFTVSLILQIIITSAILNCLKKKIDVFKAYNNYVKSKQSGLIQQPNTA